MVGRVVSHYEIVEKLGEGGMGAVYKARDTRLGRLVALKILPPDKVQDAERRRRFVQEARAASALNSPHIVTIHEIDEADGVHFIAMELAEGRTLAERIGRRGLPLREALVVASQIADALARAHAQGIVHRDLKPANIVVTTDCVAKVLDFGLAKLVETEVTEDESTDLKPATDEGTILGTAAYMSPEQAQGKRVDARSDIFSFGSVLYEMVTGRRAFSGETKVSTLAAILKEEPKPAGEVAPAVPRELERLIQHCMRKDPARRFQHMDDVRTLLDQLREDSDSGKLAPAAALAGAAFSRRARAGWALAALAAVVGVAALGLWLRRREPPAPPPPLVAVPLTSTPGFEVQPSFSPDGNEVAFAWDGEKQDNFDIYRRLIGTGEPLRLTRDPAWDVSPAWSPDGRTIAFVREPDEGPAGVYLVPALGGAERRVADVAGGLVVDFFYSGLAWTPDGRWLVVADEPTGEPAGLFLLSLESGEKRRLTSAPRGTVDRDPALSPDGRMLTVSRQIELARGDVYVQRLGPDLAPEGTPRRLTFDDGAASPVWTPDGRDILYSQGSWLSERQTWRLTVSSAEGTPPTRRPEPFGTDATNLAVSPAARRLAFSRRQHDRNLYRVELHGPGGPAGEPERLLSSTRLEHIAEYSPKGDAIAFVSHRSGSQEIWLADADGSNPRQMTSMGGPVTSNPRWSPDGSQIVFDSRREGSADLYLVGAGGGAPRRLTSDAGYEGEARWSRDGRWIYFHSWRTGPNEVWKMPTGGGESIQVTRNGGRNAFESPDGKWLYYAKGPQGAVELWRAPLAGGDEVRVLEHLSDGHNYVVATRGVYFLEAVPGNSWPRTGSLRYLDLSSGRLTILRKVLKVSLGLTLSPDGRFLIYAQDDTLGADLLLVDDFH
jgi:Tol biopolymer transport system component/tRNA A-37 threonylcarbamoyl transferase component Bud32